MAKKSKIAARDAIDEQVGAKSGVSASPRGRERRPPAGRGAAGGPAASWTAWPGRCSLGCAAAGPGRRAATRRGPDLPPRSETEGRRRWPRSTLTPPAPAAAARNTSGAVSAGRPTSSGRSGLFEERPGRARDRGGPRGAPQGARHRLAADARGGLPAPGRPPRRVAGGGPPGPPGRPPPPRGPGAPDPVDGPGRGGFRRRGAAPAGALGQPAGGPPHARRDRPGGRDAAARGAAHPRPAPPR